MYLLMLQHYILLAYSCHGLYHPYSYSVEIRKGILSWHILCISAFFLHVVASESFGTGVNETTLHQVSWTLLIHVMTCVCPYTLKNSLVPV
jgi:hypothetical protein